MVSPFFDIRFSVFLNKKAIFRFLLFACLIHTPHRFTSVKGRNSEGKRRVAEVFGRVFILTGIFIKGGY